MTDMLTCAAINLRDGDTVVTDSGKHLQVIGHEVRHGASAVILTFFDESGSGPERTQAVFRWSDEIRVHLPLHEDKDARALRDSLVVAE